MSHRSPPSVFEAWFETSSRMLTSATKANRAAVTAFCAPANGADDVDGPDDADDPDDPEPEDRLEPGEDLPEWGVEVDIDGDLSVGDAVRFTKTLSEDDVDRFAAASGDTNPLHLDEEWASETRFGGRIVHGTLAAGLISAALTRFPGTVVYLSQDLEFRAPARIGDRVTAEAAIVEALTDDRYRLRTTVEGKEDRIIDGEAVVLIDETPA